MKKSILAAAALSAALAVPAIGDALDTAKYSRFFTVRFGGYSGTEALTNFPALVRVSGALNDFRYVKCKVPGGGDLRFADADGNLLQSEVERWDTTGESLVWVKVPVLTNNTVITAHYGCAKPDAVDPTQVWDSHYIAVWHLGANDTTQPDSTSNHKDFASLNDPSSVAIGTNGMAGLAVAFDLTGDRKGSYSQPDADSYFGGRNVFTSEIWTYQDSHDTGSNPSEDFVLRKGNVFALTDEANGRMKLTVYRGAGGTSPLSVVATNNASIAPKPKRAEWNYSVHAIDGRAEVGSRAVYLNGAQLARGWGSDYLDFTVVGNGNDLFLGNSGTGEAKAFPGIIDEVRFSDIARSADWVKATYDSIRPNSGFVTYEAPHDWADYAFKFRVAFTGAPAGTLTDFPVLVRVSTNSPSGFRYTDCQKQDGSDLRFADASGAILPCEVERWDTTGESLVWVKIPELTSDTRITAYYGNPFAPEVDPTQVWDDDFLAVWHLGANATTQPDSTSNHRDFANVYDPPSVAIGTDGMVGLAVAFDLAGNGKGSYWQTDADGYFGGRNVFTSEAWTYQDDHDTGSNKTEDFVLRKSNVFALSDDTSGRMKLAVYRGPGDALSIVSTNDTSVAPKPARAEWNYSVQTLDGREGIGSRAVYLNGEQLARGWGTEYVALSVTNNANLLCLGNSYTNVSKAFPGIIDEVRLSKVARSAAWVKATHDTIRPDSGFAAYDVPNDWNMYRRRFSVTFSGAPEGTLEDFPALVRISENSPAGFRYADCQKPDGSDLRFADSGGVLLPSEVERWNPEGESLVWVKVPQLTSSAELTAYYGNAFAPEVDPTEVWDSHYIAVWHLGANDTTQPDSTSNHRDFTNICNQSSVAIGTNGMAGLAVAFNKNGKSDGSFWQEDKEGYFGGRTVFTSEAWTYQDAHAADADASNDYVFRKANVVAMSGDDKGRMKLAVYRIGATALSIVSTNDASIAPKPARAAWNYSVHTLDGREGIGSRAVYLNGEQLARGWGSDYLKFSVTNTASMLCLGNYSTNSNSRAFPGIVDEVRLSDVVRPAAWVKATYDTMRNDSRFAEYSKVKRNAAYVSITIK